MTTATPAGQGFEVSTHSQSLASDFTTSKDVWKVSAESTENCRIFIVDDEDINIRVARKYLRSWGFDNISASTQPFEAVEMIRREQPDLVLLDVMMPEISGLELLRRLRAEPATAHVPVVILTAHFEEEVKYQALELGANDFLSKPIDPFEMLPRVRNLLALRVHQKWLERTAELLETEVRRRTASFVAAEHHIVHSLARAAEFRDNETGRHVIRVGLYAAMIARALKMSDDYVKMIEQAAKLHDVGKIGIPDRILLKAGKLDPDEIETMRGHCDLGSHVLDSTVGETRTVYRSHVHIGAQILDGLDSPMLMMATRIAQTHHEHWDGTGYPMGLKGEQIPLEGRITAVADVYDALSMRRPYKPAFPIDKCISILKEGREKHFDPRVLDAFLSSDSEAVAIQLTHRDIE